MTDRKHDQPLSQPDPATKHTTDPEDHMKGPLSSMMQNIKESAEENDTPHKQKRETEERDAERNSEERDQ